MSSCAGLLPLVGNEMRARRVDSTVPMARMTAQFGDMGRDWCTPLTKTSRLETAPPLVCKRVTCALGTTKSRRWGSSWPEASRAAWISRLILLYLSKLKRPEAGPVLEQRAVDLRRRRGWRPSYSERWWRFVASTD